MSITHATHLTLRLFGLRFVSPETESAYRLWRNQQNLTVIRLAFLSSIPAWLNGIFVGYLWEPGIDWVEVWMPGFYLPIPSFVLLVVLSYSRFQRWTTLGSGLSLAISGCTMLWISSVNLAGVAASHEERSVLLGVGVAVSMIMASFALFARMPPLLAVVSISPFMLGNMAVVLERFFNDDISPVSTYGLITTILTGYFFVTVISIVNERFMRRGYIAERTIADQKSKLELSQVQIRRYVPVAVAEQIIAGTEAAVAEPQRHRVTVLFSDIVGFTDMADRLDAESMTQVINEYMATMADIVEQHGGTLNEFIGDGIMAMFGAPDEMTPENQALNAVRAAQAMQARLPLLNEQWLKLGIGEPLQIRIGINTGVLSVGSFGSEGRMTYTAIGLQTNIAARIQSHCEPGGILLSDASWHLVKDLIDCTPKGEVECKGVHFPVKVYAPK